MSHEVTHVAQQSPGAGAAARLPATEAVALAPAAPDAGAGTGPGAVPGRSPASGGPVPGTAAAANLAPGVVELKGAAGVEPGPEIDAFFESHHEALVTVQFGSLARGPIKVRKTAAGYAFSNQAIPLNHPAFARGRELSPGLAPSLVLSLLKGGKLLGHVGVAAKSGGRLASLAEQLRAAPDVLGLSGFSFPATPKVVDELEDGELRFGVERVDVRLGGAFSATVTLVATDDTVTFEGSAEVSVGGLASGKLDLDRSAQGLITSSVSLPVQVRNVTGNVDVVWDGTAVTGEGKVGYQGEKLSGEVTLHVMDRAVAEEQARQKRAPAEAAPERAPAAGGGRSPAAAQARGPARNIQYALFGEGDLNFSFTPWLTGTAHVIVDHNGYLTIIGKITPQAEIELFPQQDYVKDLPNSRRAPPTASPSSATSSFSRTSRSARSPSSAPASSTTSRSPERIRRTPSRAVTSASAAASTSPRRPGCGYAPKAVSASKSPSTTSRPAPP